MTVAVGIFAHQEERRIAVCLTSLPLDRPDTIFHVLVNGSTDATSARAQSMADGRANVIVHDIHPGGKSRTWNHFVHDLLPDDVDAMICLDGDAQIAPGSIDALVDALALSPAVNAAAGMPLNGRQAARYRQSLRDDHGLFGDLYALNGHFVSRIKQRRLRLPDDLVGDDGLVASWAHTDLQADAHYMLDRVIPCEGAGFLCEPFSLIHPSTWRMQYRRMVNYSVRFFQNRIVSDIMMREGPSGLPPRLAALYPQWLSRFKPRPGPVGWFDRKALARMRASVDRP